MNSVIYEPTGRALEYAPLALNLFDGCLHACKYCYVPGVLHRKREEFHATMTLREDILPRLQQDAARMVGDPRPILLCFTSDPYPPDYDLCEITRKALIILRYYDLHWTVLTKSGLNGTADFDLYRQGDTFAASIVFSETNRDWEPHAAPIEDRWSALDCATVHAGVGIRTWVSIEPVIYPDEALGVLRQCKGRTNAVKIGKLNYHPWAAEVDWPQFGSDLAVALEELGLPYLVKDSLAEYMAEGFPLNTLPEEMLRR